MLIALSSFECFRYSTIDPYHRIDMLDKLIALGEGKNAAPLHSHGEKLHPPKPLSWLEQIDRLMLSRLEASIGFPKVTLSEPR